MIFNLHYTETKTPVLEFDNPDYAWDCLDMLDKAFPQNSQRQYYIVCWAQYENGLMFADIE